MNRFLLLAEPLLRRLRWHRRALAAVAAAACVWCCLRALSPAAPPSLATVVAARDIPGGTILSAADLSVRHLDPGALPRGALADPAALLGRTVAGPLPRGAVLTELDVVSPALASASPGRVLVPIRIDDPDILALLRVGDRVDLLTSLDGSTRTVARRARVAALPRGSAESTGLAPAPRTEGTLVVVEVAPSEAAALGDARARGRVLITLA